MESTEFVFIAKTTFAIFETMKATANNVAARTDPWICLGHRMSAMTRNGELRSDASLESV